MDIRLLVVAADPVFREGLCQLLEAEEDLTVVARAGYADEAAALASDARPDVVVMDFDTGPDAGPHAGPEAVRLILRCVPEIAVLVLAASGGDESVFAALSAGARGYFVRRVEASHIVRAVRTLAGGEAVLDATVAVRLAGYFSVARGGTAQAFPILTHGERAVLALIASGLTNGEIAQRLFVSPKTVRNRVSNIFGKLHVPNRARAILLARSAGLGGTAALAGGAPPGPRRTGGETSRRNGTGLP